MPRSPFILVGLLVVSFSLAAKLAPQFERRGTRARDEGFLAMMLGDGRRLFANHFVTKADVYFHSGYYPSIFDQNSGQRSTHMATDAGVAEKKGGHEEADFLGAPRDWLDRFSRNFYITKHTHLDDKDEHHHEEVARVGEEKHSEAPREILPWLRLSAELDPQRVETYTVASYWLRQRMGRADQAEQFLREGWRANPDSCEILYELGRVFAENRHDDARARNVWELALRKWNQVEASKREPNVFVRRELLGALAKLEERSGDYRRSAEWFEEIKKISFNPAQVQKQIDDLQHRADAGVTVQ